MVQPSHVDQGQPLSWPVAPPLYTDRAVMLISEACTCATQHKTTWDSCSFTCEEISILMGTPTDEGPALAVSTAERINQANIQSPWVSRTLFCASSAISASEVPSRRSALEASDVRNRYGPRCQRSVATPRNLRAFVCEKKRSPCSAHLLEGVLVLYLGVFWI